MNELAEPPPRVMSLSEAARRRMASPPGDSLFVADWDRVLMIHFEVEADSLQRAVPFELDLIANRAFITIVAFTMRHLRPQTGGRLAAWLLKPIATHEFLNVRTYVRHGGETGIFFLAEWLPNQLSVALGPGVFGLPYRHGQIEYRHRWERGAVAGRVEDSRTGEAFEYRASLDTKMRFTVCEKGSIQEWLMERYTAFTCVRGKARFFRVWHPPWRQVAAQVTIQQQSLLDDNWPLFRSARMIGANFSPGVHSVWMGRPHKTTSCPGL